MSDAFDNNGSPDGNQIMRSLGPSSFQLNRLSGCFHCTVYSHSGLYRPRLVNIEAQHSNFEERERKTRKRKYVHRLSANIRRMVWLIQIDDSLIKTHSEICTNKNTRRNSECGCDRLLFEATATVCIAHIFKCGAIILLQFSKNKIVVLQKILFLFSAASSSSSSLP